MSTRWQVAAKLPDGRCGCIYVHFDGYPSAALTTLQQHYTDPQKIDRLIALGDCLREVAKWLNEEPNRQAPTEAIATLCMVVQVSDATQYGKSWMRLPLNDSHPTPTCASCARSDHAHQEQRNAHH